MKNNNYYYFTPSPSFIHPIRYMDNSNRIPFNIHSIPFLLATLQKSIYFIVKIEMDFNGALHQCPIQFILAMPFHPFHVEDGNEI